MQHLDTDKNLKLMEIFAHLNSQIDHLWRKNFLGVVAKTIVGHNWNTKLDPVWVVAEFFCQCHMIGGWYQVKKGAKIQMF